MQVVILCGGKGTRLAEKTQAIPKVLVEIGGRPILWHIMQTYASYGYTDFVLCLGYLAEAVRDFFRAGGQPLPATIDPTACEVIGFPALDGKVWRVTCLDTGEETNTGGRILRTAPFVEGDVFFATYGDGVADLNIASLLSHHHAHGRTATLTAVNPISQFGILELAGGGLITGFREKPRLREWVNGGFFVFGRRVFDYLTPDSILERAPLEHLAQDRQLVAYSHRGFWACMDTYKDALMLDDLWRAGRAPWKTWED